MARSRVIAIALAMTLTMASDPGRARANPALAIFHHASKRRRPVKCDDDLRSLVIETTQQIRQLLKINNMPPPVADQRCRDCSLIDACMPYTLHDFGRSSRLNNPFLILGEP